MKNKLYNRIIVSGLLSSSFVLFGMNITPSSSALTTPSTSSSQLSPESTTHHPHHHNPIHKIEHMLNGHHESNVSQSSTSDGNLTQQKAKRPRSLSHNSTSSSSTPVPLDPSHPLAQQPTTHHHHHHFGKKAEKIEEKIHEFNEAVLTEIIQDKKVIAEVLTPIVGEPTAEVITTGIVEGAVITQHVDNVIHNMVVNFEEEQAKKHAAQQTAASTSTTTTSTTATTTPITTAPTKSTINEIEAAALSDVQKLVDVVNNHSTIAQELLGLGIGQSLAQEVVEEIKTETPTIQKMIDDLKQDKSTTSSTQSPNTQVTGGSGTWRLIIGGTAFVVTLAGLIIMLHKYNKLPANISQLLSQLISQNVARSIAT